MRWFRKPAEAEAAASGSGLVPEPLQVTFNKELLGMKLAGLRAAISEAGGVDGLETFIEALRSKHEVFAGITAKGVDIDGTDLRTLGGLVFSVRRKLGPLLAEREGVMLEGVRELVLSELSMDDRLHAFAELAGEDRKLRRGLWDFAAEILHFRDPGAVPLASRWVWDTSTTTGALREFIRGNDTLRQIPIGDTVAAIEGARLWFYDALAEEGFYRDLPFVTDLIWSQAYSDYARSLSMSMGLIDAQFGARQDPLELMVKMLGIDAPKGRLKAASDETLH
jgi:hypothetical protein